MYSTSPKLRATGLCFLLYQETVANQTLKIQHNVLFMSLGIYA